MPDSFDLLISNVHSRMDELGIENFKDLAEMMDVSGPQVSAWLKKRRMPKLDVLDNFARHLKTTPAMLLRDSARDKLVPTEPSLWECLDRTVKFLGDMRDGKTDSPDVKRIISEALNKKRK